MFKGVQKRIDTKVVSFALLISFALVHLIGAIHNLELEHDYCLEHQVFEDKHAGKSHRSSNHMDDFDSNSKQTKFASQYNASPSEVPTEDAHHPCVFNNLHQREVAIDMGKHHLWPVSICIINTRFGYPSHASLPLNRLFRMAPKTSPPLRSAV